jgi:hypothetical protein
MLQEFVTGAVCAAFQKFCEEKEGINHSAFVPTDHPVEPSKPLHEGVHQDDLRLESVIKVYGKNIEVVSQSGGFTMPGASGSSFFRADFEQLLKKLAILPAQIKIREFFNQRDKACEKEERQRSKETFVDGQAWNFGSENLTSAMEQEQPDKREAA